MLQNCFDGLKPNKLSKDVDFDAFSSLIVYTHFDLSVWTPIFFE